MLQFRDLLRCRGAHSGPHLGRSSCVVQAAQQQQGPPIVPLPPALLAAGGINPAQDGPEAQARFTGHLAANYTPVNVGAFDGRVRVLHVEPPVLTVERFVSYEQCDALVAAAQASGRMAQSGVGGHNVGGRAEIRTSRTVALTSEVLKQHPDLESALEALLACARMLLPAAPGPGPSQFSRPSGPGALSFELPQVAHYTQGQHFLSHEDAFPTDIARQKGYQRQATLLVYLNDVHKGGRTKFDHLGLGVQPRKGQALLFFPSFSWGAPDRRTLHTAEDAADDKWIFQLWLSAGLPQQQQQMQAQQQKQAGKVPVPPRVQRGAGTDKKKSVRWMR